MLQPPAWAHQALPTATCTEQVRPCGSLLVQQSVDTNTAAQEQPTGTAQQRLRLGHQRARLRQCRDCTGTHSRAEHHPLPKRNLESASQSDLHRLASASREPNAPVLASQGDALGHEEDVQVSLPRCLMDSARKLAAAACLQLIPLLAPQLLRLK